MNEEISTNQTMSRPTIELKEKPDSFSQSFLEGAKSKYGYLKETLADRYDIATGIMASRPKTKETGNFFTDAVRAMYGGVTGLSKAIKGEVDISEAESWKKEIARAKELASKNRMFVTAGSTPSIFPDLKKKMNLIEKYKWSKIVEPVIWDKKVVDTAPRVVNDTTVQLKRSGAGYEHGGRYFPCYDVLEDAVLGDTEAKYNTLAHEFLHKFFRDKKTSATENREEFDKEWDEIKANTKDKEALRMLSSIDYTLSNNPIYSHLSPGMYDHTNERFAHLGDEIGRKDYRGPAFNSLLKYYNSIFKQDE